MSNSRVRKPVNYTSPEKPSIELSGAPEIPSEQMQKLTTADTPFKNTLPSQLRVVSSKFNKFEATENLLPTKIINTVVSEAAISHIRESEQNQSDVKMNREPLVTIPLSSRKFAGQKKANHENDMSWKELYDDLYEKSCAHEHDQASQIADLKRVKEELEMQVLVLQKQISEMQQQPGSKLINTEDNENLNQAPFFDNETVVDDHVFEVKEITGKIKTYLGILQHKQPVYCKIPQKFVAQNTETVSDVTILSERISATSNQNTAKNIIKPKEAPNSLPLFGKQSQKNLQATISQKPEATMHKKFEKDLINESTDKIIGSSLESDLLAMLNSSFSF
ncbi:hypothetical protein HK100_004448 [Physocladia obscura]|uniref:Uncharacterized protein n=1 Tax=Physocladia obscura TaxID=109957 RepID=A0AAD5SSV6_9FUNG|nr:hypothetical protein HK100_004448 [Physocladia obscura]